MQTKDKYLFWAIVILCSYKFSAYANLQMQQDTGVVIFGSHHYYHEIKEVDKKHFLSHPTIQKKISSASLSEKCILKKGINVFGWHPHWLGDIYKTYNYSLLTHVAYLSCDVNPLKGTISNYNGWDTSNIVSFIKAKNQACKVLLTVTCFGYSNLAMLLRNSNAKKTLIDELFLTINYKKADGVCIDFESIPPTERESFTEFITNLKLRFKQNGLTVMVTLPSVDSSKSFDIHVLSKYVDLFVLMGYDYSGPFNKDYAGPIAPLKRVSWMGNCNIENSVNYYLNQMPDSLLLLGVPYYGAIWETQTVNVPSKPIHFIGYRSYGYLIPSLPSVVHDTDLKTSYCCYQLKGEKQSRQCWLDDTYSLGEKYDFVLQNKLGGIGIFALGFDGESQDLWDLLKLKFAEPRKK